MRRHHFRVVGKMVAALAVAALLSGCSALRRTVEVPVYLHDTTVAVRELHDSTYVDRWHTQWMKGDTVFIHDSIDRWHSIMKNDTVWMYKEVPVPQKVLVEVEKELSWWQKTMIGGFCVMAVLIALAIAWRLR